MKAKSEQSSKKAVTHRGNSERPQNRHLRPWKKGDPNIPKSPGRPPTRYLLREIGNYLAENSDGVNDYFKQPIWGKKRMRRLLDLMTEKHTVHVFYLLVGKPR